MRLLDMDVSPQRASGLLCAVSHLGEWLYPASPILALFLTLAGIHVCTPRQCFTPLGLAVFPDGEQ